MGRMGVLGRMGETAHRLGWRGITGTRREPGSAGRSY